MASFSDHDGELADVPPAILQELDQAIDAYHSCIGDAPGIVVDWVLVAVVSNAHEDMNEVHTVVSVPEGQPLYRTAGMLSAAKVRIKKLIADSFGT